MRQNKQQQAQATAGNLFLDQTLGNVITSTIKSSNKLPERLKNCHHWRDARLHQGTQDKDSLRITKSGLRGLEGSMTTKTTWMLLTFSPQIQILKSIHLKLSSKTQLLNPEAILWSYALILIIIITYDTIIYNTNIIYNVMLFEVQPYHIVILQISITFNSQILGKEIIIIRNTII